MKTVAHNVKGTQLPMRLFEIGDVVLLDNSNEMGARNERRMCAVFAGESSTCFEIMHGARQGDGFFVIIGGIQLRVLMF